MRSDAASNEQTLHRRGLEDDPLYKVRRTLLTGDEHLTDRQREQPDAGPTSR